MLRDRLLQHHDMVDGFRWRSREITRIEGFSDAVFGFAVTLLIVSLEVPRTSTELFEIMRGFLAFVVTFTMLAGMWYAQYTFFRRYGLEDRVTVVLNLVLLFTVLFFTFPLKFLFGVMLEDPTLRHLKVPTAHGVELAVAPEHRPLIFLVFGAGFAAVFTVFALLYGHAYRKREELGLNEFEIFETRHSIRRMTSTVGVAIMYMILGGVNALPTRTLAQRKLRLAVAVAVLLGFLAFLGWLFKLMHERRMAAKAWKAKQAEHSPEQPPS